jgi:outer membrane lipoprotein SlyB
MSSKASIRNVLLHLSLGLLLTACASKPIIDTLGVDLVQYQEDLQDCAEIAEQVGVAGQVAKSAGAGAAAGAGIGLVTSVITGDASAIAYSAAYGAVGGGTAGAFEADEEKANVIKNCLRNRGYVVLN